MYVHTHTHTQHLNKNISCCFTLKFFTDALLLTANATENRNEKNKEQTSKCRNSKNVKQY